jgi:hypothetical protein
MQENYKNIWWRKKIIRWTNLINIKDNVFDLSYLNSQKLRSYKYFVFDLVFQVVES